MDEILLLSGKALTVKEYFWADQAMHVTICGKFASRSLGHQQVATPGKGCMILVARTAGR